MILILSSLLSFLIGFLLGGVFGVKLAVAKKIGEWIIKGFDEDLIIPTRSGESGREILTGRERIDKREES